MSMSVEQERHLARIKGRINLLLDAKYRLGQAEHKNNLWQLKIMPELLNEVIDLVSYGLTLEEHIEEVRSLCAGVENGDVKAGAAIKRIKELL